MHNYLPSKGTITSSYRRLEIGKATFDSSCDGFIGQPSTKQVMMKHSRLDDESIVEIAGAEEEKTRAGTKSWQSLA